VGVEQELSGPDVAPVVLVALLFSGALMVSNVRFNSFKELDLKGRVPFIMTLAIVLVVATVSYDPPIVLFAVFALYALSGPCMTLVQIRRRRAARHTDSSRNRGDSN